MNIKKSNSSTTNGQVRIIAGQWRSRKLNVINQEGLRPSSDRLRETLFNWLEPSVNRSNILDCFAGSGILSLEALSRGASSALMLEKSTLAIQFLKKNTALLKANAVSIEQADTLKRLESRNEKPFDIVFIDPPFNQNLINPTYHLLKKNGYLHSHSLIYIESERSFDASNISECLLLKTKTLGAVTARLYQNL